ncbi:MAG: hypothetical protein DIZ80_09995 [endosymbiont of Galathealinum brachiosum]|uniref:Bacterial surface antigen (D15) domain-containing protein n=1 Tax=endosymbiont of Galathealinum brachiosum TaxID=2200906 RepID=A0A370DE79_9GAMM|nr:MAG: hypothetical protein DIZ80_09995 [endosymbiont of Galathealinum brachiosum]
MVVCWNWQCFYLDRPEKILRKPLIIKIISLFFIVLFASTAHAVDPRLNWKTLSSPNFNIHYAEGYEGLAQKTVNSAEQAHAKLHPVINWQPDERTHIVISDETDSANGFATPIHFNRSVLFLAPPESATSLEDFDDWLETLITHEYTHILHLDKTDGGAEYLRNIFGRQFLLFPNMYQPGWFIEGLATYHETDVLKGIGRGQSSLFKMMMRIEVENGVKPASQINLPIRSWPMGTSSYLYGVHFYQYVEQTYGRQGIDNLIENYSDNIIPFMINSNSEQVFNKNIDQLWHDFSIWLNERYLPEIEEYKNKGLVEGSQLTFTGYNTGPVDVSNKENIFYISAGAFEHAELKRLTDSDAISITDVHRDAKLDNHPVSGTLITQNEYCDEYNINSDIYIVENGSDELKRITQCGRYRSASWSADGESIVAVKLDKAKSQLVLLNKRGEIIKHLWKGNDTDIVTQLKCSPSGDYIVAAVFRKDKGWNIEELDLKTLRWTMITDDRSIDMYPSYSENGDVILFSSEKSGRYQIYRYYKNNKQLDQLTRVSTGAFESAQLNEGSSLYYVGYNENGRDIYKLENVKSLSEENKKPAEDFRNVEAAAFVETEDAEGYSALSSLHPRWWLPFISLNEDRNEIGITTSGNDALGIHNYFSNIAYDTTNEWLVGNISYAYANRFSIGYQRSTNILRDSAGDFAVARNTDDIFLSMGVSDPGVDSSIRYQFGVLVNRSTDGERAVSVPEQIDTKDNLIGGAVIFSNTKNYIRSISQNDGRNLRLLAESSEVFESDFSGEVYTLDWREFLNLGHQHVLAMRLTQGWGTDRPESFRLGGEDNEVGILDFINPVSEPLFGKRNYALRGYAEGLPQLSGRRMQLATVEWRFPGALTERGLMSPPVGLIQWSGSLFAETGAAYESSSPDDYFSSAGIELQADVNLFYGLTTRMRLGFASGFDELIGENRVYFNLGASF